MPNPAHLHLILNHFPIIGTAVVVLVMGYGVAVNNDSIKKLGMFLIIFIGLMTFPVFFTGEKAEGFVKGNEGIAEEFIEDHEEFADISFKVMEIISIISLAGIIIFRKGKPVPVWFGITLLILLAAVNVMMIYTGHLGGRISHFELMNKQ